MGMHRSRQLLRNLFRCGDPSAGDNRDPSLSRLALEAAGSYRRHLGACSVDRHCSASSLPEGSKA